MDFSRTRVEDHESLDQGVWMEHPHYPDLEVRIRPFDCEPHRKAVKRFKNDQNSMRYWRGKLGDQTEIDTVVYMRAVQTLITDWRGKDGKPGPTEDGEELKFSTDLIRKFCDEWVGDRLSHKKFFEGVRELAQDLADQEQTARQATLGN